MVLKKVKNTCAWIRSIPGTAHKPYLIIFFELLVWLIANKSEFNVYFQYGLFLKGKRAADFVTTRQFKQIEKQLNSPDYFPILEDKYFFSQVLEGHGFRAPKNLFLADEHGILNMESRMYNTNEEFLRNDFNGFCKLINGYGGKMIFQLEVSNKKLYLNKEELSVADFMKVLDRKRFLIQERIIQHEKMNLLNPSCINTMRLLTLRNGQTFQFYQGFMRIGINNSIVDNGAKGNILIGIDNESGTLMKYADSLNGNSQITGMERHPQTLTVFQDFEIPFYSESLEMVKSLHSLFRQFFMIGWDIGITPDGPIVIEGNNITSLQPFQALYGGLKPTFFSFADEYKKAG